MAQRVFLIQIPTGSLERAVTAITGDASARHDFAAHLAHSAMLHLRRVTVSEMVVDAAGRNHRGSEEWSFARNCMPYLIAATRADAMCGALQTIEGLRQPSELEDFFVTQAQALGMTVANLDREKFVEPQAATVEKWIYEQLEKAAELRAKALSSPVTEEENPVVDYAISTWVWLGRIFARTSPSFWQGRNRWLGGAAFPDAFTVQTNVTSIRLNEPPSLWGRIRGWFGAGADASEPAVTPELARFITASQEHTRTQLASKSVQRLRGILVSTATLSEALAVPKWEESLPKEGGGDLVSGAVAYDRLDELVAVLRQAQADGELPYETGNEWIELVVAAAQSAKDVEAHLVEGDDSIYCAHRWPAIDE